MDTGQPALSVVIPSYDDAHRLELTLRSLTRQTLARDLFEVIVVRDGPGPGYDGIERAGDGLNLRVIELPARRGRAGARNAGIAVASAPVILFLDADAYAVPDLLERHHRHHLAPDRTGVLLGASVQIGLPQLRHLLTGEPVPAGLLASDECVDLRFPAGMVDDPDERWRETPWLYAYTHNTSVRAELLGAVGGFHEEFGIRWGWEDLELFYRVHRHPGGSFAYDPDAVAYHLPHARDAGTWLAEYGANEAVARSIHPNLDWEFSALLQPTDVAEQLRYYRRVFAEHRADGTGRLAPRWAAVRDLLGIPEPTVVCIATDTDQVDLTPGSLTIDHARPAAADNPHRVGAQLDAADATFDAVINVNAWRSLIWWDLCRFLAESTRVARTAVLLYPTEGPAAPARAELDYLIATWRPHFAVTHHPGLGAIQVEALPPADPEPTADPVPGPDGSPADDERIDAGARPELSVVIPSYGDGHRLAVTLRSLTRQTLDRDLFEVIVVRDGPGPGYDGIEQAGEGLDLRVILLPARRGRAAARNAGIAAASAPVVLLLDADGYTDPDLLARHHRHHAASTQPGALLGKRYEIGLPELRQLLADKAVATESLAENMCGDVRFVRDSEEAATDVWLQTPWLFGYTHNASVSTDLLRAVGGFNEEFGLRWGWEDVELFYRLDQHLGRARDRFAYDAEAICYHLPHYRELGSWIRDHQINQGIIRRTYPHLDWEFSGFRRPIEVASRVRHYRAAVEAYRHSGEGRLAQRYADVCALLGRPDPAIVCVATDTAELPLPPGTLTFDYSRPPDATNHHLIGTTIPAESGSVDAVVSVGFWRALQWSDLCDFLGEANRVGGSAVLLFPADGEERSAEAAYLAGALHPLFAVTYHPDLGALRVTRSEPITSTVD